MKELITSLFYLLLCCDVCYMLVASCALCQLIVLLLSHFSFLFHINHITHYTLQWFFTKIRKRSMGEYDFIAYFTSAVKDERFFSSIILNSYWFALTCFRNINNHGKKRENWNLKFSLFEKSNDTSWKSAKNLFTGTVIKLGPWCTTHG